MKAILALTKKELLHWFSTPIAYVFLTVYLVVTFSMFFGSAFLIGEASLRPFFSWQPLLLMILLPSVTMGLWADEKKSGTFELLMTLPVSDSQIILGKYFASLVFLFLALLFTLPLPTIISSLGDLDWGPVLGAYLGLFLLGGFYLALGLFLSVLTRNQIVAFIVTVVSLFFFYILAEPIVTSHLPYNIIPLVKSVTFSSHFMSLARGVIDVRDVIYFVSGIFLFLSLNSLQLAQRRVKG